MSNLFANSGFSVSFKALPGLLARKRAPWRWFLEFSTENYANSFLQRLSLLRIGEPGFPPPNHQAPVYFPLKRLWSSCEQRPDKSLFFLMLMFWDTIRDSSVTDYEGGNHFLSIPEARLPHRDPLLSPDLYRYSKRNTHL